jgi:hypothetical protein
LLLDYSSVAIDGLQSTLAQHGFWYFKTFTGSCYGFE